MKLLEFLTITETTHPDLGGRMIPYLRALRQQIRKDEGYLCGQAGCSQSSEFLEMMFGWPRECGTYLGKDLETLGDHCWNFLSDGSILDITADQFKESHGIKVVSPDDPEYYRYRMEYYQDYHPGYEFSPDEILPTDDSWSGEYDLERFNTLRKEKEDYWWTKGHQKSSIPDDWQERIQDDKFRPWGNPVIFKRMWQETQTRMAGMDKFRSEWTQGELYRSAFGESFITEKKKFRKPMVMYHGTSDVNLRSILKNGIVPLSSNKVWGADREPSGNDFSLESLSGSYWTSNLITAQSSATNATGKFKGQALVVIAQIAEGSAFADEDSIAGNILGALPRAFNFMRPNGYGLVNEAAIKSAALIYFGGWKDEDISPEKLLQTYIEILHESLAGEDSQQPVDVELMREMMEAHMMRVLAFTRDSEPDSYYKDQYVKEMERLADEGKVPVIPSLADAERTVKELQDRLTRKYRKTAYIDDTAYNHTLRLTEPVTFRGANKILCIIGELENWKELGYEFSYKAPLVLYYGTPPADFYKQYEARVGTWRGAVNRQGEVVIPPEQKEMTEAITVAPRKFMQYTKKRIEDLRVFQNALDKARDTVASIDDEMIRDLVADLNSPLHEIDNELHPDDYLSMGEPYMQRRINTEEMLNNLEYTLSTTSENDPDQRYLASSLDRFIGYAKDAQEVVGELKNLVQHSDAIRSAMDSRGLLDPEYPQEAAVAEKFLGMIDDVAKALPRLERALGAAEKYQVILDKRAAFFRGEHQHVPETEDVEKLWHATAYAAEIAQEGFTAAGRGERRGVGTYGEFDAISFTHDYNIAREISRGLKELTMIANGQLTRRQLLGWFQSEGITSEEIMKMRQTNTDILRDDSIEAVTELYNIYLWKTGLRSNPVFANLSDLVPRLKGRDPKDVGIIQSDVNMRYEGIKHQAGEAEWLVPAEAVQSVKRVT